MPQTRMFRDRMVSMEQTLERGEKHLEFLKALCKEVFPEFDYREHALDHERDLFLMTLEAPDGRRKTVGWTRMVLFDTERLPTLLEDPNSPLGIRLKSYLKERSARPEIVVTFRHLEEGWVDTPEPRRDRRRRRGRGRQHDRRDGQAQGGRPQPPAARREPQGDRAAAVAARPQNAGGLPRQSAGGERTAVPAGQASAPGEGRRRRRRFRRRRGRGGAAGPPAPAPPRTS
ncbi:MAG TPA: hypothetical protein VKE50_09305 [Thermoanaerobaculia bacterium]|nr:hypothetical protein [Thermoanaerobaculia bacterium]